MFRAASSPLIKRLVWCGVAALLAACAPQPPPPVPTATSTLPPLLPIDPTSTPDLAVTEPTFTPIADMLPTLAVPTEAASATPTVTRPAVTPTMPPSPTPTVAPTMQPALSFDPTPTPETLTAQWVPTARPVVITPDLWRSTQPAPADQTFTGGDLLGGTLTVPYPSGWQTSGDANGLILTNAADPAALNINGLRRGEAAIFITVIPSDLAPLAVAAGFEPSAPLILANFIAEANTTLANATWGQIWLARAGMRSVAFVNGSNQDDDALVVCVALETGYALITAVSDRAQMLDVLPTLVLVARELSYSR